MMPWYCEEKGCLATYPCAIHPPPSFVLQIPDGVQKRRRFDKITTIEVIPLPCHHNLPRPLNEKGEPLKKFNAKCEDCSCEYYIDIQPTVAEILRIN